VSYCVCPAGELPGGAGGKSALIAFYRYARAKAKLFSVLGRKPTTLVFFLDKDVDDLRGTRCRSPHVVYTAYYDVQNHLFRHGDFIRAVSSAVFMDQGELERHPDFGSRWCQRVAHRWREWIVLCLLGAKKTSRSLLSFRL
jgi:hypothetical protein